MAQPTTQLQISGQRFLAHRMQHALVRGDARMLDDPLSAQSLSLVAGAVLAAIVVGVCAVLALVRPDGSLGDSQVVVARESGAMYVRIDDVWHPVFNLASARLIAGSAVEPAVVTQRSIDGAPRGVQVGLPDAPARIAEPLGADEAQWAVCDDGQGRTTILAGPLPELSTPEHVLVTPRGAGAAVTYLLHDGRRSRVDLRHPAVVRALRLDGAVAQPISDSVLAAIPEAPPIAPPHIPGRGGPGPLRDHPVGSVVAVARTDGSASDYYVVLAAGLQRIGEVTADLIRYTDPSAATDIARVSADTVGAAPVVDILAVATYPATGGVAAPPAVCAQWRGFDHSGSRTAVFTGEGIPSAAQAIALPTGDGNGPGLDAVSVPPGRSLFVRSIGLTGAGLSAGPLFLITETGLRYGIRDVDAAKALGLDGLAVPAPWPVLAELTAGPELSLGAGVSP